MSRIQKKCFIASTGFHLFLVLILFVGPGFFTSSTRIEDTSVLTFVPDITTDEKIAGGGSPKGGPPPPTPMQQQRQPQAEPPKPVVQEKVEKPALLEPVVKEKPQTESMEPATKPKVKVNLTKITRKPANQTTKATATKSQTSDESPSKDLAAVNSVVKTLKSGLSTGTSIDMPAGPGGGGPSYANFNDAIKKIYSDAWVVPDGVTDDNATVTVSVTIARNGEVTDTSILVRSGNAEVDDSVAATLRRVRFAVPLPAAAKEDQRTVKIRFNVRAQRMLL